MRRCFILSNCCQVTRLREELTALSCPQLTFLSDLQGTEAAGLQLSQGLQLDGQAVAVPAGHVVHLPAPQHLKAITDVLQYLGKNKTQKGNVSLCFHRRNGEPLEELSGSSTLCVCATGGIAAFPPKVPTASLHFRS